MDSNCNTSATTVEPAGGKPASKLETLGGIVGKHLLYTYQNGWRYELYIKNACTLDYRIHSGIVAGRWVKNQTVILVQLPGDHRFKMCWTEVTGTSVSLTIDLSTARQIHGTIFFPHWVHCDPLKTACFQNDHIDEMLKYRDAGPTYPLEVVNEFASITFIEDRGPDDDQVIACSPVELPSWYATRLN